MSAFELLASNWIWYALFGGVAALFFLGARRRGRTSFGASTPVAEAPPSRSAHPPEGGKRHGHGCC